MKTKELHPQHLWKQLEDVLAPRLRLTAIEHVVYSHLLRRAIRAREGGRCFYCLRQTPGRMHCLDRVVPRARSGRNSYRNLVSCCMECNSAKRDTPAPDFLRSLYREGHLTKVDLTGQ